MQRTHSCLQDSKIVGVNSASVGWVNDFFSVPGFKTKRSVMAVTLATKMTKAKVKKIVPMVARPVNR